MLRFDRDVRHETAAAAAVMLGAYAAEHAIPVADREQDDDVGLGWQLFASQPGDPVVRQLAFARVRERCPVEVLEGGEQAMQTRCVHLLQRAQVDDLDRARRDIGRWCHRRRRWRYSRPQILGGAEWTCNPWSVEDRPPHALNRLRLPSVTAPHDRRAKPGRAGLRPPDSARQLRDPSRRCVPRVSRSAPRSPRTRRLGSQHTRSSCRYRQAQTRPRSPAPSDRHVMYDAGLPWPTTGRPKGRETFTRRDAGPCHS